MSPSAVLSYTLSCLHYLYLLISIGDMCVVYLYFEFVLLFFYSVCLNKVNSCHKCVLCTTRSLTTRILMLWHCLDTNTVFIFSSNEEQSLSNASVAYLYFLWKRNLIHFSLYWENSASRQDFIAQALWTYFTTQVSKKLLKKGIWIQIRRDSLMFVSS